MHYRGGNIGIRRSFISLVCASFFVHSTEAQNQPLPLTNPIPIKIAQVDWCPQICIYKERPGYIIEILEAAFADSEFDLIYSTYSWSRGISHTTNGETIGLLAAAPKETPGLIFPRHPIGVQQACFYTLPDSEWRYTTLNSMDNVRIGLPNHISLEELNDYQKEHPAQFHLQASTPRYIELSINMLERGRLDTFVFFRNTVIYHMQTNNTPGRIQSAGCVSATPVYIVFTPAEHSKTLGDRVRAHYDMRYPELKKSGTITRIMTAYGLPDWSTGEYPAVSKVH